MIGDFTIVDGHVHTFSSDEVSSKILMSFNKVYGIEFENPGTGTIDDVLKNMDSHKIDYTIMANFAPAKILHNNNKWTLDSGKKHSSLVPLVSFHPDMEGDLVNLLKKYIIDGAKGIKFHTMAQGFDPNDDRLKGLYEFCNEISFPIVFHCGRVSNARLNAYADVDMILPVVIKYRNIPFILTHMADGNVDDVIRLAKEYRNVYFDTSIVITGFLPIGEVNEPSWLSDSLVEGIVNKIGAERLIFGSDYPWGSPGHDIKRFLNMKLSDHQKQLILGANALRLFIDSKYE